MSLSPTKTRRVECTSVIGTFVFTPIARALLKAHEGDVVELRAPTGPEQIEVLEIRYGTE
jgi:Transcription elongation factor, GreA/GreB, C-term